MSNVKTLPARGTVKVGDTWDLSSLFASDDDWENTFKQFEKQIPQFEKHRGKLGESAKALAACLRFDSDLDRLAERLGTYAFLKTTEDQTNSVYQRMNGRFQNVAVRAGEAADSGTRQARRGGGLWRVRAGQPACRGARATHPFL